MILITAYFYMYIIVIRFLFIRKLVCFLAIDSSNGYTVLGIDTNTLSGYITDIKDNVEIVKSVFNNLENIANDTMLCFEGDIANAFNNKFTDISYYFPVIEKNLLTYVEDLNRFIDNYEQFSSDLTTSETIAVNVDSDI